MPLRLASINIEGEKHLDQVTEFVAEQKPNVVCLQEVFTTDIPRLEKAFGMHSVHTQNVDVAKDVSYMSTRGPFGVAVFSALPFLHQEAYFYSGSADKLPVMQEGNPNSMRRSVQIVAVKKDEKLFRIANTHLTWTPDGSVTTEQLVAAQRLLQFLSRFPQVILVGDLNAPRGKETFSLFASQYTDNIPPDVVSTLDPDLHRAGALPFVVDALFTSPDYQAENVEVHTGVSDHRAVVADVR